VSCVCAGGDVQVLWEAEPCVWMVLVVKRAKLGGKKDSDASYSDDDVSTQVMDAVLRNGYHILRLFYGSIQSMFGSAGAEGVRRHLDLVLPAYISTLPPISKLDLPFALGGVRYFPVDRNTFLSLQSFFHLAQQDFPAVCDGICLYNDMLVWTSLCESVELKALYTYLLLHVIDPSTAGRRGGVGWGGGAGGGGGGVGRATSFAKDPEAPPIFQPYNRLWILPLNLASYSSQQVAFAPNP
jgi:hypothetical protein